MSFDDNRAQNTTLRDVSIPLEQGNVFRQNKFVQAGAFTGLNPFGTGQCLSTTTVSATESGIQGSQSLWNRAMSFDVSIQATEDSIKGLNPFGTGQCLSTYLALQHQH